MFDAFSLLAKPFFVLREVLLRSLDLRTIDSLKTHEGEKEDDRSYKNHNSAPHFLFIQDQEEGTYKTTTDQKKKKHNLSTNGRPLDTRVLLNIIHNSSESCQLQGRKAAED